MTHQEHSTDIFFKDTDLTPEKTKAIVVEGLKGADFGEFYQETMERESLSKDKGAYTGVSVGDSSSGFGFRVGQGERIGYSFSDVFNEAALKDSVKQSRAVLKEEAQTKENRPQENFVSKSAKRLYAGLKDTVKRAGGLFKPRAEEKPLLYPADNPMAGMTLAEKIAAIDSLEAYAQNLDVGVSNVTLQYSAVSKDVHIITADGQSLVDHRPMASLVVSIAVTDENGKTETGQAILGGRMGCKDVFNEAACRKAADEALQQAKVLLTAGPAPAGVMDVVLSPGWSAVILHEAVGHGLEGDFNRRNISVYSGKLGQTIASPEVTVIDQGDLAGERGSLHFDDEGTPGKKNVLIENGVLKGYMQDRQNAALMGVEPTGNGRRQSYAHLPMPRMTNTYFANGTHAPEDIIKSVKDGLYISDMGGGQVDITSGKFNMNARLAYRIRDGKICEPVKGATLVGDGLTVIQSITMVGNDLKLERSRGNCGKNGQSAVVGCGQPTIRVSNMTVGGTGK